MSPAIRRVRDFFANRRQRRRLRSPLAQERTRTRRRRPERKDNNAPLIVENSDSAATTISAQDAEFSTIEDEEAPSRFSGSRWDSLPADIIQAVVDELPRSAARQIRLVNRHWAVATRALIKGVVVNTKTFTHHSRMGTYLSRLADGTYCNLRQLKLCSQFRDGYQKLTLLTNVTSLDVSGCYADTHQFSAISSMTRLVSLSMGWTRLTDEGINYISPLTNLESLNLEWCYITEASLHRITGLTKLARLNICGLTWFSEDCLQPISVHKGLTYLDCSWMHLTGKALEPISGLKNLTTLNLAMNPLDCNAMRAISGLVHLRKLNLKKTNVGNEGLQSLTALVRLRRLNLSGTSVDDRGIVVLTHLGLLSSLDLSDNYMIGWEHLEHLTPLTSLIFLHQLYLQKTQADSTSAKALANKFRPKKLRIEY